MIGPDVSQPSVRLGLSLEEGEEGKQRSVNITLGPGKRPRGDKMPKISTLKWQGKGRNQERDLLL